MLVKNQAKTKKPKQERISAGDHTQHSTPRGSRRWTHQPPAPSAGLTLRMCTAWARGEANFLFLMDCGKDTSYKIYPLNGL